MIIELQSGSYPWIPGCPAYSIIEEQCVNLHWKTCKYTQSDLHNNSFKSCIFEVFISKILDIKFSSRVAK